MNHASPSRRSEAELLAILITRMAEGEGGLSLSPVAAEGGHGGDREVTRMLNSREFLSSNFGKDGSASSVGSGIHKVQNQYPDKFLRLNQTLEPNKSSDSNSDSSDDFYTKSVLQIATEESRQLLDAAREHSEDLFNPGEGYSCQVTAPQGGQDQRVDWRQPERGRGEAVEVAVGVVYLRLVGTRGCTKVSVVDRTQRASFR